MVEKDKFLVVVSILEGRNFPKRAGFQLVAEARFDGELLCSDPVSHVDHPEFTQELAWELTKKSLHQHRLQRSSIKVQVYAVNVQTKAREAIGYIVLDLRSATNQQNSGDVAPSSKWHLLLHGKYHKTKPELRVGLYVDEDKGAPTEQTSFKAKDAPPRVGKGPTSSSSTETSEFDLRILKPILNEAEGLYQIGPVDKCSEHFVISVTIAFATNLPQLIPTSMALPNTGFFFYYSLLGNDVTNEPFSDLINPNFPAERASVRARSSVEALRMFFTKQPGLQIHLCCGDQSLGSAEVPLHTLIKKGSTEIYMRPVTIEGAFPLNPPNRLKQQLGAMTDDLRPMVGVSIAVRKEDQTLPGTPRVGSDAPGTHIDEQTQTPRGKKSTKDGVQHSPPQKLNRSRSPAKSPTPGKESGGRPSPTHSPSPHDGSYTDRFDQSSKTENNQPSLREDGQRATQHVKERSPKRVVIQSTPEMMGSSTSHVSPPSRPTPNMTTTHGPVLALQQHPNGDPAAGTTTHHYCCSIDLRALRNTDMPHPAHVFLRYTYAFFGSVAPILTHPPVDVRKGSEVILPQSFCAFDFATTQNQLLDTFNRVPLVVEVWNRDTQRSQNVLIGASKIVLTNVLQGERTRAVHNNGSQGWRQVLSERVPVVSSEGSAAKRVAELELVISLEDWGQLAVPGPTDSSSALPTSSSESTTQAAGGGGQQTATTSPRHTLEYKAAMELEMWKEQQEALFEEQLRSKEKQYMLTLAEEWKRRNKDRELVLQKQISAYTTMEEKLKVTLTDLNKRERQLAANEQEVIRLRSDLQREHERKMTEMREASRRLTEECEHRITLERNKIKDLEDTIQKLKQQLADAETKNHALDKEFGTFREQQNSKPEVRLQSEINLLTLEKVELERKLEAATKSKVHYKQQWGRALKELARLKQREQAVAKQELRRQQQELEHMRLRYLAAEEKEVVNADKQELEEIKKQIQMLKEAEVAKTQQLADMSSAGCQGMSGLLTTDQTDFGEDEHISRLIEERDTLLRTGVYTTDDRIISELDRQIREAISKRSKLEATSAVLTDYHTKQSCRPHSMVVR